MKKYGVLFISIIVIGCILLGCKKDQKTEPKVNADNVTLAPDTDPAEEPEVTVTPALEPTTEPDINSLKNSMTKEDYPIVDGSTATIPLSEAVYMLATGASAEEAAMDIVHTKTSNSYYRLMDKEVDLLIVYAPSEQVLADIEKGGNRLDIKPIGKDALVFMANTANPVESLTHNQLIDIYSGKITNWSQVGGEDREIQAFQRPENSGSQTLMQKLVMGDTPMVSGPSVVSIDSMEGILEAMAEYTNDGNALGYSVFYYAQNMYRLPELRFMKVNNIEPSLQTIYDNTYPYINEFYAVIRKDEAAASNARQIFDWLTEQEGQTLIRDLGYIPVTMDIADNSGKSELMKEDEIPEGYLYIAQSTSTDSGVYSGTVTIYQGNWEPVRTFQNAHTETEVGLVLKDQTIIIGYAVEQEDNSYVTQYGLFDLEKNNYMIPPYYESIYLLDEEKGYYVISKEGRSKVIDAQGKEYISDTSYKGGFYASKKGDFYWLADYSGTSLGYDIYDRNFQPVKEIHQDYGSSDMYDPDGTLVFTKEMFMEHFGYQESPDDAFWILQNRDGDALFVVTYNQTSYVLDWQLKLLAQKSEQQEVYTYYTVYYDIFTETHYDSDLNTDIGYIYDKEGNLIVDEDGFAYTRFLYQNYYSSYHENKGTQILYGVTDHTLRLYWYQEGNRLNIDLGNWGDQISVPYVYNDIVIVQSVGSALKTRLYKGQTLLYELDGSYYPDSLGSNADSNAILLYNYDYTNNGMTYLLLGKDGALLYESPGFERIISIDPKYIQLERGNYWGVMDYEGNYIIKGVKNSLKND